MGAASEAEPEVEKRIAVSESATSATTMRIIQLT
jgi:hypothetical protein